MDEPEPAPAEIREPDLLIQDISVRIDFHPFGSRKIVGRPCESYECGERSYRDVASLQNQEIKVAVDG